jgi:signal transduction histidine kinase
MEAPYDALLGERSDFLAVINHRLRNSLLANERVLRLLVAGDFGDISTVQETVLKHVLDNSVEVDRVMRMLVDLYEYRTGTKHLEPIECSLDGIVEHLIECRQHLASEKRIKLTSQKEGYCKTLCDEAGIKMLLDHILTNAITHALSEVTISLAPQADRNCITITDDGPGIPQTDLSKLFSRFYVRSQGGKYAAATGIGLCLCAEIANANFGDLTCESDSGSGTTFRLTLPAR